MMKRISLLFSALLFTLMVGAQAITLQVKDMAVKDVLPIVEEKSGYHFFYNSTTLPRLDKKVSLDLVNQDLKIVLNKLFEGTNIEYTFTDNNVIALSPAKTDADKNIASVSGVVVDEAGLPIIGATVTVKNTNVGTITDFDGNFSLENVKEGAYIAVSYIGYETYEQRVSSKTNSYRVTLKEATSALDEVVVVGYGSQKKVNLTGAVSVVKSDDIVGRPTANMVTALQGADPALNIAMSAGSPNASYNIDIRGMASINSSSSTQPLVLVDGVEMDLVRVNTNDIESVSILKDASASAIYGSKAAAGVVLVTTKSGREGLAPQVTVDLKAGFKTPTTDHDYITSGFWSAYISDLFMRYHTASAMTTYNDADYAELWMRLDDKTENPERPWVVGQTDKSYKYYANYDWYDHYYKTIRPMQDYNISVKGGNDKVNYFVSGRYYGEDGMYAQNTDKWNQFSTRAKLNVNIKKWLHYGINFSFFNSDYTYPGTESSRELFRVGSLHAMAFIPSINPDGSSVYMNKYIYSGTGTVGDGMNALLNYGKHANRQINREMAITNTLTIDLCKNLTLNGDYSFKWRTKEIGNRSVKVPYSESTDGTIMYIDNFRSVDTYHQQIARYINHRFNVYLKWDPTWDQHHLTLTAGYNGDIYRYHSLEAARSDLMTEELSSFNFAKGEVTQLDESILTANTNGFFGRVNYDFGGRYLFEFSIRADGSSRFAKGYRWAVAPGGSFGWRMSEESFWEPISNWWSNSKLRLSAGQLGNQMTGYYDYMQMVNTNGTFDQSITLDGTSVLTYATETDPNAGTLTWEKMTTYDVGLDLGFFKNRLSFTGDFYVRNTTGMLNTGSALPAVYGASDPKSNSADMRTLGWELALAWNDVQKVGGHDFKYQVSFGIGDYQTKVTKFDNPTGALSTYYEGQTLGEIWGYDIDGLFQSQEEIDAYLSKVDPVNSIVYTDIVKETNSLAPGLSLGDVRYVDLNGDSVINSGNNTKDNAGDRHVIGNSLPRYSYNFRVGVEYFGFDAAVFFQGVGKRDWYPSTEATIFWGPYSRPYQGFMEKDFMSNVWSETNRDAYFPLYRAYEALGSANSLGPANSRYLQSIAYLRLKSVSFGYTLPCWKKVFSQFRIYFAAENPWYYSPIQKYSKSVDPESAAAIEQGITYGFAKSFTFGIMATF